MIAATSYQKIQPESPMLQAAQGEGEDIPKESVLDTSPLDGIEATLNSLNQKTANDSDVIVDDDHQSFLLRKTLHAVLDDICYNVRGFEVITTHGQKLQAQKTDHKVVNEHALKSYKEMTQEDISLDTLRAAIDRNCFTTFDEFEFALFRVIEQANQQLMNYRAYYEDRHAQVSTLMKQQCIQTITKSIEEKDCLLTDREKHEVKRKHNGRMPVQIELMVACRGRGRPVKNPAGRPIDPRQNTVIKPKTYNLSQLTLDQLTQIADAIEQKELHEQRSMIQRLSEEQE